MTGGNVQRGGTTKLVSVTKNVKKVSEMMDSSVKRRVKNNIE
tara:strand:- start:208 stop:333 length:126 start_codon:yes stop_codon:yes gene_type:complete